MTRGGGSKNKKIIDMKKILNKKSWIILGALLLAEALSFIGYLSPNFNKIGFVIICLATIFLAVKNLRYGLLLVLVELVIGSKGYLFFYEINGAPISIRIAMWLIVMSVWLASIIRTIYVIPAKAGISTTDNNKQDSCLRRNDERRGGWRWPNLLPNFAYAKYFYALALFITWGVVMALFRGNDYSNIFFDLNNWFYLSLLFPIVANFKTKEDWTSLKQILGLAVTWLCFKTLFLLYFFSHNLFGANLPVYRWLGSSGVGEVTQMASGFFRIFFQSHIYALMALFLLLPIWVEKFNHKIKSRREWFAITGLISIIIIALSRSFWVGLFAGLVALLVWLIKTKVGVKQIFKLIGLLLTSAVLSLVIITVIIKFPLPTIGQNISAWDVLNERGQLNESAVSSRWSLIPKLWQAIKVSPIVGQGFGKTVTYQSSDPRILEQSVDGTYETYAFEWGWLDMWLKMGILGVLTYLLLLIKLTRTSIEKKQIGPALCLITLATVNFFTPYLNHPLGLGIVMLTAVWLNNKRNLQ